MDALSIIASSSCHTSCPLLGISALAIAPLLIESIPIHLTWIVHCIQQAAITLECKGHFDVVLQKTPPPPFQMPKCIQRQKELCLGNN